ncbi:SDR family NAD(P)-dependent oxidoreductase [Amaricoccus tamworthensis]|uniref:SDR family NAD(P)-dependent oxidoreductase n=1 Tax=Amaricoccus tamworthensis TaxID=57002 RepID=UPI003C7BF97D
MKNSAERIWIIGSSSGIGAAVARAYAKTGAELILSARNSDDLAEVAQDCGRARVIPLDLADEKSLRDAIERISENGPLDKIICTAALYKPKKVSELSHEDAEAMVRVNLLGMIDIGRLCPPLLRDGGQLVLFGSVAGYVGLPAGQPYSATKAGVNSLAESLAVELAPRVDVRLVSPGFVRTRLTDQNDFDMPAMIEPEEAADALIRGLKKSGFEIHFPRRFTFAMKFLRILPYPLMLRLTRRIG